jgi:CcmD family protein
MNSLIAAYLIAWVAVASYLGMLGVQNRRLAHRLGALESHESPDAERNASAKAA